MSNIIKNIGKKNQEEMLENKQTNKHLIEMKGIALMNSVVDWTCPEERVEGDWLC